MSVGQKLQLLQSDEVEDLAMLGSRGEFESEDLVAEVQAAVAEMRAVETSAGYQGAAHETGKIVLQRCCM